LLRSCGVAVVEGRTAGTEEAAAEAFRALGGPVAVKVSDAALRHKSQAGALALGVRDETEVRAAWRRFEGGGTGRFDSFEPDSHTPLEPSLDARFEPAIRDGDRSAILIERMAPPGAELLVAVRTDAAVPALVLGLGGIWTEAFDDVAIVPLPVTPARAAQALATLRGASTLEGRDTSAAATLAARLAEVALEHRLELLECNPVIVHREGAVVVDATAKEVAT
jgi:acetate---CoA ligase (ADP-forming)